MKHIIFPRFEGLLHEAFHGPNAIQNSKEFENYLKLPYIKSFVAMMVAIGSGSDMKFQIRFFGKNPHDKDFEDEDKYMEWYNDKDRWWNQTDVDDYLSKNVWCIWGSDPKAKYGCVIAAQSSPNKLGALTYPLWNSISRAL